MARVSHESAVEVPPLKNTAPVQVAVAGVGGYAGGELARLLLRHPRFASRAPVFFGRASEDGTCGFPSTLAELHPSLTSVDEVEVIPFDWTSLERRDVDVLLLATPHDQSHVWVPEALQRGIRVIDLSGAWRLNGAQNRATYRFDDESETVGRTQEMAVYGSPELHKDAIRQAQLIANPGCYATSIILALAPLVRLGVVDLRHEIVCDAKSGVSGAGKTPTSSTHFMAVANNLSAYAVFGHRHTGELLEQLALTEAQIRFTPHLLPIPRGILSTIYLRLEQPSNAETVVDLMREFYSDSPFVRLRTPGTLPQIQDVLGTNFCDLGVAVDRHGDRAVLVSCLDNLLKGAAGQAIQNLNLMCGWTETEGLL